jgi:hypothetical protein
MSSKLGLTELLGRIGDDNIQFQNIEHDMTNIALGKGGRDCKVTFATDPKFINPTMAATGQLKYVPLVLWLPKELVDKAMEDLGIAPARSGRGRTDDVR